MGKIKLFDFKGGSLVIAARTKPEAKKIRILDAKKESSLTGKEKEFLSMAKKRGRNYFDSQSKRLR